MNPKILTATARRVLTQLRHDPRSVALMVFVPALLMVLLRYVFNSDASFDHIAPSLLAFFPFLLMFLTTSVTMQRERTSGTLERLLTTPAAKLDLLGGYGVAFSVVAVVQVVLATLVSAWLGLSISGSFGWLLLVALLSALVGVALGLLASAFARTEFQALQFMPVVVLPQFLLCGLFRPRDAMADVLRWASDVMPLSYAVEAVEHVTSDARLTGDFWRDVAILAGCTVAGLTLAAATLRRRTD
ncbi:MAG TPA: ABC transporter permease [Mycobacteriales bacterium]|nr:ABC transporter permease [Mycobacteriales bacterium]